MVLFENGQISTKDLTTLLSFNNDIQNFSLTQLEKTLADRDNNGEITLEDILQLATALTESVESSEPIIEEISYVEGYVILGGYVSEGNGSLYDINYLDTPLEQFVTDINGKFILTTAVENLPEAYMIQIDPDGGRDKNTGNEIETFLRTIGTKQEALNSLVTKKNIT